MTVLRSAAQVDALLGTLNAEIQYFIVPENHECPKQEVFQFVASGAHPDIKLFFYDAVNPAAFDRLAERNTGFEMYPVYRICVFCGDVFDRLTEKGSYVDRTRESLFLAFNIHALADSLSGS